MNTNNVINEVFADLEKGQFDKASNLFSESFKTSILGKEVNRSTYISTYRALLQGMPDMKIHVQDIKTADGKVTAKVLLSGTNSQPIPALMKGWHQVAATHKKVDGLVADLEITLKGDKVEQIRNKGNEKGIFINLLDHLGLDYKKMQEN